MKNIKSFKNFNSNSKQFESKLSSSSGKMDVQLWSDETQSYWNNNGIYQAEYDKLFDLVPQSGSAETLHGELIRAVSRINYEYFNNGNGNAWEVKYSTETAQGDWNEEDGDYEEYEEQYEDGGEINAYYQKFLTLIERTIPETEDIIEKIEYIMENGSNFTPQNEKTYSNLIDAVVFWCITSPDGPIPSWYKKN